MPKSTRPSSGRPLFCVLKLRMLLLNTAKVISVPNDAGESSGVNFHQIFDGSRPLAIAGGGGIGSTVSRHCEDPESRGGYKPGIC